MFITIEGIDGCGKSTQIDYLKTYFQNLKIPFLITREPGGTDNGSIIRELVLDKTKKLEKPSQFLLYMADRVEHVEKVIKPALKEGRIVICDRYVDSTMVYQGYINGMDTYRIKELHNLFTGSLLPNLTILIDIDPLVAKQRTSSREGSENDTFDSLDLKFYSKVRNAYLDLQEKYSFRIHKVDGNQSKFKVYKNIIDLLKNNGIIESGGTESETETET